MTGQKAATGERIDGAAIRLPRGIVYSSGFGQMRHGGLIAKMRECDESVGDIASADQGFVTDQRRFLYFCKVCWNQIKAGGDQ